MLARLRQLLTRRPSWTAPADIARDASALILSILVFPPKLRLFLGTSISEKLGPGVVEVVCGVMGVIVTELCAWASRRLLVTPRHELNATLERERAKDKEISDLRSQIEARRRAVLDLSPDVTAKYAAAYLTLGHGVESEQGAFDMLRGAAARKQIRVWARKPGDGSGPAAPLALIEPDVFRTQRIFRHYIQDSGNKEYIFIGHNSGKSWNGWEYWDPWFLRSELEFLWLPPDWLTEERARLREQAEAVASSSTSSDSPQFPVPHSPPTPEPEIERSMTDLDRVGIRDSFHRCFLAIQEPEFEEFTLGYVILGSSGSVGDMRVEGKRLFAEFDRIGLVETRKCSQEEYAMSHYSREYMCRWSELGKKVGQELRRRVSEDRGPTSSSESSSSAPPPA